MSNYTDIKCLEKKEKQLPEKNKIPWWIIALLILLAILYFTKSDNLDEYSYCIDDCVYDVQDCISSSQIYDSQGNAYIEEGEADSCVSELEYCVSSCESDYGN